MTEQEIANRFRAAGIEQPLFEARQLLREVSENTPETIKHWVERRIEGYPLAYLSGRKGFYKSEFLVEPGVLIPRPETEHVVEEAVRRSTGRVVNIVDLGCGSGCLGLSVLGEFPGARLWAVDASAKACEATRRNAGEKAVTIVHNSVETWETDLIFDLVVANPPYIAENDPDVQESVRRFEPHEALYSPGADGLDRFRAWSVWTHQYLRLGGVFACELGARQGPAAQEFLARVGFVKIEIVKDLAGFERVISAIKG